jgi:gliding motility-associated-like protein
LYALNDGVPGVQSQFSGLDPGTYTVSVQGGNGCSATLTTEVNEPQLLNITVTPEASIDLGYTYQINAEVNIAASDIASVLWTPATGLSCDTCLVTDATPFTSTRYFLVVTAESGCTAETSVVIKVDKSRDIYVPNIFTPNEDGVNDFFNVFTDPVTVTKIKSFQVFSRWGEAVYELKDFVAGSLSGGWDGTYKGEKMNPGVFVWQVVVEYVDGKEEFFKGDVTLQR